VASIYCRSAYKEFDCVVGDRHYLFTNYVFTSDNVDDVVHLVNNENSNYQVFQWALDGSDLHRITNGQRYSNLGDMQIDFGYPRYYVGVNGESSRQIIVLSDHDKSNEELGIRNEELETDAGDDIVPDGTPPEVEVETETSTEKLAGNSLDTLFGGEPIDQPLPPLVEEQEVPPFLQERGIIQSAESEQPLDSPKELEVKSEVKTEVRVGGSKNSKRKG